MLNTKEIETIVDFLESNFDLDNCELPDEYYYTCFPLCLLDAVFSIGVRYSSTRNAVQNYCSKYAIPCYNRERIQIMHGISDLIRNIESMGSTDFAAIAVKNRQRTSSKNGILKAEAVLRCAKVFQKYQIENLTDFREKMTPVIEKEYLSVKGQASGISLKYLNMLCGDEDSLKPDRHIIRFLNNYYVGTVDIGNAEQIMREVLDKLIKNHPELNMRKLDYIIWQYQSNY